MPESRKRGRRRRSIPARDPRAAETAGELARRTRDETRRRDALARGTLAEQSLRPRIAPRANSETRRSGRRTVRTRAGRRSK